MTKTIVPDFIPREALRVYCKPPAMNKYLYVDHILPSSFIARCERQGRPLPSVQRKYRLLDVLARARAEGVAVTPGQALTMHAVEQIAVKLEGHRLAPITAASVALTGATLLTNDEVAAGAMPLPLPMSGVYFLVEGRQVVYVGQSRNLMSRLATHVGCKMFDRFAYIPCPAEALDLLESLYIHALRPSQNGRYKSKNDIPCAPLRLDEILRLVAP